MQADIVCYVLTALLEVAVVTVLALYPLRHSLHSFWGPAGFQKAYNVEESNLDVWVQSLVHVVFITVLVLCKLCVSSARARAGIRNVIRLLTGVCQALLLAKAVTVALLGSDEILPYTSKQGQDLPGILLLLLTIFFSAIALAAESYFAQAILTGSKRKGRLRDAEQPLLTKVTDEEEEVQQASETLSQLLRYSAPDTPLLLLAFAAGCAAALAQALIPYLTGQIIDYASIDPDRHMFFVTTLKLVAVAFACAVVTGVRGGIFTICMCKLNVRIRSALFASLLRQEIGFYDASKTGAITSRLAADTTTVSDQICLNINVLVRSITQAAMVLVFMLSASWRLTVITFILLPATISISRVYGAFVRKLAKQVQTELAEANSVAEEVLASMSTVKAHAAEQSAHAAYMHRLRKFYTLQLKESLAYGCYASTNVFLPNAVNAVVLFYGGTLVLRGQMSAGALVAFMLYQQSLASAFQQVGDVFSSFMQAVGAAEKVLQLIRRSPGIVPLADLKPPLFMGHLSLEDITFAYPTRPQATVLNGLSFTVKPGEVVALVGPSGGGKSSIVKLIQRFYLPSRGRIMMDGRDVGLYSPQWLRRKVALVSQEPTLYARSIRRNICYGLEEEDGVPAEEQPSGADVEQAARSANAHNFIMAMPGGYDADVGDKGLRMSGGEKQRLAIARALVRRPSILLLDEATSALDADSESAVKESLDRVMTQHTTLVIAHRLSTVQHADRILVISKGVVAEEGNHEQLLSRGGIYSALVQRQMSMPSSRSSSMAHLSALSKLD